MAVYDCFTFEILKDTDVVVKPVDSSQFPAKAKEQKKKFTLSCHLDATKKLLAAVKGEIEL